MAPRRSRRADSQGVSASRRRTGDVDPTTDIYTYDHLRFGKIQLQVPHGWTSTAKNALPSDDEDRFVWTRWEDSEDILAYMAEQRGQQTLVITCPLKHMNEVTISIHDAYVVDNESLGAKAKVFAWDDLHLLHDSVGDHYYYRTLTSGVAIVHNIQCGVRPCLVRRLPSSDEAYLVCNNADCRRAFHTRCLSDQPICYKAKAVLTLDGVALHCPHCATGFTRRDEAQDTASFTHHEFRIIVDIGTTCVKAMASYKDSPPRFLHDVDNPTRPLCCIEEHTGSMRHDRRDKKDNFCTIAPLKKLFCGAKSELDTLARHNLSVTTVAKSFFTSILRDLHEQYLQEIPDLDGVHIVYAVALPAALDHDRRNTILGAIMETARDVQPIILNEAKLSYLGAIVYFTQASNPELCESCPDEVSHPSPRSAVCKVLSIDIGGYTTDIMLAVVDLRQHCELKVIGLASVYCGADWAVDQLAEFLLRQENSNDDFLEARGSAYQFWEDLIKLRKPAFTYRGIDFESEWNNIQRMQRDRAVAGLGKILKNQQDVTEFVLTGGGARDEYMRRELIAVAKSAMSASVQPRHVPPPSTNKSTVLQGAEELLRHRTHNRPVPYTVLLEVNQTDNEEEYIIINKKGECMSEPVVPASRARSTILFDIEVGDDHVDNTSSLRLLGTLADLKTKVSAYHYQTADLSRKHETWVLADIKLPITHSRHADYLAQAVELHVDLLAEAVIVQAVLLAPKDSTGTKMDDWELSEATTIDSILARGREPGALFDVVSSMPKTAFTLDVDNVSDETHFIF